jgi:HEAT repeat protein
MKKVVAFHIARLQDRNRDVRLKSIAELAQIADPDALDPLRKLFENDPDIEVRKAAQEAGRNIFKKINGTHN